MMRFKKKSKKNFWDKEYSRGEHLALSTSPSEDFLKFTRWLEREHGRAYLNPTASALDLGCGNGRNLLYLGQTFGMRGIGYDTSREAINQAIALSKNTSLVYENRSIGDVLPIPDNSQTIVLDMMSSHFLNTIQREKLRSEILRVLKPGGWFFFKTFLLEEDEHAKRLLQEHPTEEKGTYIHPKIGMAEHVSTEKEIIEALSPHFLIEKIQRSHRHLAQGRAFKRRSISIYAQKKD